MDKYVKEWINQQRDKGVSKEEMHKKLVERGYSAEAIRSLLPSGSFRPIELIASCSLAILIVLGQKIIFKTSDMLLLFFFCYAILIAFSLRNARLHIKSALPILFTLVIVLQIAAVIFSNQQAQDKQGNLDLLESSEAFDNFLEYYETELLGIESRAKNNMLLGRFSNVNADVMEYGQKKDEMISKISEACTQEKHKKIPRLVTYCSYGDALKRCKDQEVNSADSIVAMMSDIQKVTAMECEKVVEESKPSEDCVSMEKDLGIKSMDISNIEQICQQLQ